MTMRLDMRINDSPTSSHRLAARVPISALASGYNLRFAILGLIAFCDFMLSRFSALDVPSRTRVSQQLGAGKTNIRLFLFDFVHVYVVLLQLSSALVVRGGKKKRYRVFLRFLT